MRPNYKLNSSFRLVSAARRKFLSVCSWPEVALRQTCVQPPAGLVSWWPGDGNTNDIIDGNPGTLLGGTTFTTGKVGLAFSFDGVDDFVRVPDAENLGNFSALTVDGWIKTSSSADQEIVAHFNTSGPFDRTPS